MTSAVSIDKITIDKNNLGQLEVKDNGITFNKIGFTTQLQAGSSISRSPYIVFGDIALSNIAPVSTKYVNKIIGYRNVAYGITVPTTWSDGTSCTNPQNLVDGNIDSKLYTEWSDSTTTHRYLTIDLGQVHNIKKVYVKFDHTHGNGDSHLAFLYSTDNTNWTQLIDSGTSSSTTVSQSWNDITARYFKFEKWDTSNGSYNTWCNLYELLAWVEE